MHFYGLYHSVYSAEELVSRESGLIHVGEARRRIASKHPLRPLLRGIQTLAKDRGGK